LTPEHATAQAQVAQLSAALTGAREQAQAARTRIEGLTGELANLKARTQAHLDLAERLNQAERQLTESRAAAAAREDAAHLRGQAETLSQQNVGLMQALKFRDGRG
jgi:predicted  nucleic acid-binding Zn-ribbon protein